MTAPTSTAARASPEARAEGVGPPRPARRRAPAERVAPQRRPDEGVGARAAAVTADAATLLDRVPEPEPGATSVGLLGRAAGGLSAVSAQWRVDGGEVLLAGSVPFAEVSARAGFRSDGSLDGSAVIEAEVGLLGLPVARATWRVGGWDPGTALALPEVVLQGTTLAVDLTGIDADVAVAVTAGLEARDDGDGRWAVALPAGTLPPGVPLEPRVVELFSGLLGLDGADLAALRVHPDAPVGGAPAFVSDRDLFFAPSRYGADSPETAALLDAAIRSAVRGIVGAVAPTPQAPPPQPAAEAVVAPAASADPVPATVPPAVDLAAVAQAGAGRAEPAAGVGPEAEVPGAGAGVGAGAGAAEAAAEGPAVGGSAVAPAPEGAPAPPVEVELLMPPAPSAPGPEAAARMGGVGRAAGGAASAARDLPSADATVAEARGAVTEPAAETAARAQEALAEALGERPAPSPEIVELCERIRTAIREQRPVDEDELLRADPTRAAQDAGATVSGSVEGQVDQVEGSYADLANPPAGTPALTPEPVVPPDPGTPGIAADAATAAPDPIPAEDLSLDADVAATDARIAESGIDTRVTREIPGEPFAGVRAAQGELGEMAAEAPEALAARQAEAIATAQADMAALQQQAVAALRTARGGAVGAVGERQSGMVGQEEATREGVSARAQQIFDTAQGQVEGLLEPLTRTAMARWDAGLAQLSREFHDALDRVQDWIDERHSGVGGFFVGLGDAVFGLPGWVIREYDRAEREFGDGVCELLLGISTDVNGVVAAAQAIIAQARDDIDATFAAMEEQFPEWAAQERARFAGMLDGLAAQVTEARTGFVRDVSRAALDAVAEAQAAVEERREAARGVIGRIVAAIEAFIEDPVRAIIDGLLTLVGIPPAAFWALVARIQQVIADIADDPERFINNLMAGIRAGFEQFFDNFGTHVLTGFWNWLFSGLETPIPMPRDMSAGSLLSFALQLMGITWPRVREILVRHVGERNVALIEAAWQAITMLIELGPAGIVEMLRERLTPEMVVQTILEAAVEYLVETLIQQVIIRVIGMLNPVGAVAQAIDAIYQVLAWVFRNAARIFHLIEAVVNGMADVIAGNIGGLASAVERALAMLIPPVIDFLAGLLHMGGLPGEVADVIVRLQATVYQALDVIIGTIAERGRALLASMGLGGQEEEGAGEEDTELGTVVRFTAAGDSHRFWVQAAGDQATLMVASVPAPIAEHITRWRGKLAQGEPADEEARGRAEADVNALESQSSAADTEADRLQAQFRAAATNPTDEVHPPSDATLEGMQRSIATLLDRLFTAFGEQDQAAQLADIRANLPGHGQQRAEDVVGSWVRSHIGVPEAAPLNGARQPVWVAGEYTAPQFVPADVLAAGAVHTALLGYFQQQTEHRGGAATQQFASYALVERAPNPSHDVRSRFLASLGNRVAVKLRSDGLARLSGTGDSALRDKVLRIQYAARAGDLGSFEPWPEPGVSALVQGLILTQRPIPAFEAFVRQGQAGGLTYEEFVAELRREARTRSWLADQLRGVTTATHEWIPVSIGADVLDHAVTLGRDDLRRALGWVTLLERLRSPTNAVLWRIVTHPQLVPAPPGAPAPAPAGAPAAAPAAAAEPLVVPAGHVGSLSLDRYALVQDGLTVGTGEFHDALRAFFTANRGMDPAAWVDALLAHLPTIMWTGSNIPIPSELRNRPIGVFYAADGGWLAGMTVAELQAEQQRRWEAIVAAFRAAKSAIR